MAVERSWDAIGPVAFTATGGADGTVTVSSVEGFKVKQSVVISAVSQPDLKLEVKRVLSPTKLIVGPVVTTGKMLARQDISAYNTGNLASIRAEEQKKSILPPNDTIQAVYEQEPTVAIRNVLVDQLGSFYNNDNPLPTSATINVDNLTIPVNLDAFEKVPPDNAIAVGTEDGTLSGNKHAQKIGSDGKLEVKDTAADASLASLDNKMVDLNTTPVKTIQLFTKPFKAITRIFPDPSPGVEVYQSRLVNDVGPVQETATVTYADGATKEEFLKIVVV